jgi:adenylylsulfate reductase subunit A
LAMGSHQSRWFTNSTNNPFNIWQNPVNTGTQIIVAYDVGAKVKNLEWCTSTTLPKGFGAPGMCAFGGMGTFMRNALGENFMKKYHGLGERAPRAFHIRAEGQEIAEGRTPLFVDATKLPEQDMRHLCENLLSVDKHTFGDYLEQRSIDLRKQALEVETGEFSGGGNLHVDINCESVNIKNLFGLPFSGMLSTAVCGGYISGTAAAKRATKIEERGEIDQDFVREEKGRIFAPLQRDSGYSPREFEDLIRQIMEHYMGHKRSLTGLNIALEKFKLLEGRVNEIRPNNYHELTRSHEAIHLLKYCQLMIRAVIERRGMRGFYNLVDYPPKLDHELRDKYVVLSQENGKPKVTFEPIEGGGEVHNAA